MPFAGSRRLRWVVGAVVLTVIAIGSVIGFNWYSTYKSTNKSAGNLWVVSLGIIQYQEAHLTSVDDIRDENGKPLLSWRVRLLPFIDEAHLYMKFHLDEP